MPFTPKFADMVRNLTTVTGTGPVNPGSAVSGFTSLSAAVATGEQFYYCIQGVDKPAEREVGRGTMQSNGTITREAISGTLNSFTSGSKTIALVAAAEWFSRLDALNVPAPFDVATRSALATASLIGARPAYLCEKGREGLFVFDPANRSAEVTADTAQGVLIAPSTAPSGASGAWVRQHGGALRLEWFGAVAGDYDTGISPDCLPAWTAAMNYLAATPRNDFGSYVGTPEIHFSGAQYYFSETLQLKRTMRLRGMGSGYAGGAPTMLRFAANKAGIVVNRNNTLGDVADPLGSTTGGDGSIIEGFYLFSAGGTPDLLKSGIRMRARALVRDCLIGSFPGAGVCIVADTSTAVSNPYYGNADNWRLDNVRAQACKYGGFYVSGGDANAGLATMCDASKNGRYGFADLAFLGNSWIGCHTAANGLYQVAGLNETSVVTYLGNRYYLVHGQDTLGASTTPGTNAAVWAPVGAGGVHPEIPTWGNVGDSYVSGGSYVQSGSANQSPFVGCYYEGGQAPAQIRGAGIVLSGFMGNGQPTGAPHLIGSAGLGLKSQRPFSQQATLGDGTIGTVSLGGTVVGNVVPAVSWSSAAATPFNPGAPSHLKNDGDTGDLYWDSYGFRSPLRLTGYSTARTYGGRTQPECRNTTEIDKIALGNGAGAGNASIIMQYGTAAPTTGTWGRGDIVWNNGGGASAIGSLSLWRCTVAGTPGTWVGLGGLSSGAAIGYTTGSGGAIAQTGGKSGVVTLNTPSGRITMDAASLAAGATTQFQFINTTIGSNDVIVVNVASGGSLNSYEVGVALVGGGQCRIQLRNIAAAALAEAVVINFAVIKGVIA